MLERACTICFPQRHGTPERGSSSTHRGPGGADPRGRPWHEPDMAGLEIERVMRSHPVFAGLNPDQFALAMAATRTEDAEPGKVFYERGAPARHFFIVLEGRVRLSVFSRSGAEKVIEILAPGKIFGELGMFSEGARYPVTAVAASKARVARIPNRDYLLILRECPETCLAMLGHLAGRLIRHVQQIEEATLDPATDRLVRLLESRMPEGSAGPVDVRLDESRQELASFLSMKPETLSRALRTLTECGAIEVHGRYVHIPNRDALLVHLVGALQ
jgi:CRP-like cAMP-binding protein